MFCASCGCAFASPAGHSAAAPIAVRSGSRMAFIVASLVLVGCLAFALGASGILQGKASGESGLAKERTSASDGLTRIGGSGDAGLMKDTSSADSGVTQMATPTETPMPNDIRDWLEHLRRTEEKRVHLANQQLGKAMRMATMLSLGGAEEFLRGMLADPDADPPQPHEQVEVDVNAMRSDWADLHAFFNTKTPPAECMPIYNEYDPALNETGAMISDILAPLSGSIENKSDQDNAIAKLLTIQNKSKDLIDKPAIRADDLVQKICDKYHTPKWFKIVGDIGGGGGILQTPAGIRK